MTLMVLAIRLYDTGLRDDAVFWFYVAKNRYSTLEAVADVDAAQLAQVQESVRNFAILAGPSINGHAFCDVRKQQAAAERAYRWVVDNPYQALFIPQLAVRPGDRADNLAKGLVRLRARVDKERAFAEDPAAMFKFDQARVENLAEDKYCWK